MPNYFFTDTNGTKRGPLTPQQLKALAEQGRITPSTPLETDTGHKGLAGQIRGLFSAPPNPPPATPSAIPSATLSVGQAEPQCAAASAAPAASGNKGLLFAAIGGGVLVLLIGIAVGWLMMSGSSMPAGNQPEQARNVQVPPINEEINDEQPPPALLPEPEEPMVTEFRHTDRNVNSAAFSPDGMRIVTTNLDRIARVWDIRTGEVLQTLEGHALSVTIALFSPDGQKVVTASNDNTARIWDAETGEELHALAGAFETGSVRSVLFSPDGTKIFTGSTGVGDAERAGGRIWDVESGRLLQTLEGRVGDGAVAAFSPDGKKIVAGVGSTAQIWDVETGAVLRTLEGYPAGRVFSASFSPDGTKVVTAINFLPPQDSHDARIWDAESGALLRVLEGHTAGIWSALFSPDGTKVVTASFDQTARIWDAETGAMLRVLDEHTGNVRFASFSPDGTKVITASFDHTARIWKLTE